MSDPRIPFAQDPPPGPDRRAHGDPYAADDGGADYSATVLGSHWFDRPQGAPAEPDTVRVVQPRPAPDAVPDRVEGSVLRFGPGVTASARRPPGIDTTAVWHGAGPPAPAPPRPSRRSGLRRYALAAVVLLAVVCYLGWQRYGPALEVRGLRVEAPAGGPACDSAADIVAVVRTNGRAGTLGYRWVRSDGTRSEPLTERMAQGRREARLHLLWTFRGRGEYRARARVELLSPAHRSAAVEFTYRCGPTGTSRTGPT